MYAVYLFNMPRCNLARVEGSDVEICTSELKTGFKVEVSVNKHCSLISRITKGSMRRGVGSLLSYENRTISQDVSRTQWASLHYFFLMVTFSDFRIQALSCSIQKHLLYFFAVHLCPLPVILLSAQVRHCYILMAHPLSVISMLLMLQMHSHNLLLSNL